MSKDANIYTILITNSKSIDEDARIYAGNCTDSYFFERTPTDYNHKILS